MNASKMPLEKKKRREQRPATEEFMLSTYKVVPCNKRYPHNWKRCPFAHEGEAARRRDPRTHFYSDTICPDSRKVQGVKECVLIQGQKCPRGESCRFTHNLFEYWLLPSRFKTQLCSKRERCKRPFCFFAHIDAELRDPGREDWTLTGSGISMLHDSFGSHVCLPTGAAAGDQGYLENKQLQEIGFGQAHHQSDTWEFFESSQSPKLPESMLATMDHWMAGSPHPSRSDCLESSLHHKLQIDSLQAGVYSMLDHPGSTHSADQLEALPSLQILQSLCAGRNFD